MNLLKDIDDSAKLQPLRNLLEGIEEFELDKEHEYTLGLIKEFLIAHKLDEARSEFDASRGLMKGAGIDPNSVSAAPSRDIYGKEKESRIGLLAKHPQQGDPVISIDQQTGKMRLVGVIGETDGKTVFVKDPKSPFGGGETYKAEQLRPEKKMGNRIAWSVR